MPLPAAVLLLRPPCCGRPAATVLQLLCCSYWAALPLRCCGGVASSRCGPWLCCHGGARHATSYALEARLHAVRLHAARPKAVRLPLEAYRSQAPRSLATQAGFLRSLLEAAGSTHSEASRIQVSRRQAACSQASRSRHRAARSQASLPLPLDAHSKPGCMQSGFASKPGTTQTPPRSTVALTKAWWCCH